MRDAIGGSVVLVIIVFFIVVALGYMAFNVNYTKAFRMKDKVIAVYEDYDGDCGDLSECAEVIEEYRKEIGYDLGKLQCPEDYKVAPHGAYCYHSMTIDNTEGDESIQPEKDERIYYSIITKINIDIPIINNVFNLNVFNISGDTKPFDLKYAE